MPFWGMSQQGKDAQNELTNMPRRFQEQGAKDWARSEDEFQYGQGLRNDFVAYIREMIANGVGSPEEILALAEQIMPGVSEAVSARQGRTTRLRGEAANIPSASQVRGEMDSVLDNQGTNITGTKDRISRNISDTTTRQMAAAERYGKDRVSNIRDVSTGMNDITDSLQSQMTGDLASTMSGLRKASDTAFTDLDSQLDPAFNEMLKRVEAFKPGGEARASRVGRSFNPAYASVAARLRRGGVDLTSPEAVTALGRIDTARANAMDDSLAEDTERYVTASNSLSRDKLGTRQNLALQKLANSQGLSVDELKTKLGLDKDYGNVKRGILDQTGRDFRSELSSQEKTARDLDLMKLGMDTDNENTSADRTTQYNRDRNAVIKMGRDMGMQDFEIQQMLEDRANEDDLVGFKLKNEQFDRGMNYRMTDLNRRDQGAQGLNQTGNSAMNASLQWNNAGGDNMSMANRGYQDTFERESANAGWGKKLLLGAGGAAAGAAADYFLPGSGSMIRGAAGGGQQSSANPFASAFNKIRGNRGGASSLPTKQGSPINPYGGYRQPSYGGNLQGAGVPYQYNANETRWFAEGGVVDDPTMAVLGEAGEREYVVPESKAPEFAEHTMETGLPPDPAMLSGMMSPPAPPKPSKFQLRKLDEAIKAEQSINKSWDERIRDAMKMDKMMNPDGDIEYRPSMNSKAMKMKHASDSRLEELLDLKTEMLEASIA